MSDWLTAYTAMGLQATLLVFVAAICLPALRRRVQVAAAALRATVVILLALTLIALCPLPAAWQCFRLADELGIARETEQVDVAGGGTINGESRAGGDSNSAAPPASGIELARVANSLRRLLSARAGASSASRAETLWNWRTLLAIAIGLGIILAALRLAWGFRQAQRLLRRSRSLCEPQLDRLCRELCVKLGRRVACRFRESSEVRSAAVFGWRRPVVLLAADWRTWTRDELRAVVAHELAHAMRRDCLLSLLGGIAAAVFFYHPLLWWLSRRLAVAQELVADQLAAACFDEPDAYLVSISRLALRQDERRLPSAVLSFSNSFTTLLRRLEMLKDKDVRRRAQGSTVLRVLVVAGLAAAALAASSLRMTAVAQERPADQAPAATNNRNSKPARADDAAQADSKSRPAIDLAYLNPENQGFWSLRPAVAFESAKLRPYKMLIDAAVNDWLHAHGVAADVRVSVAEIEQTSGPIMVKTLNPDAPPGERGRVMFGFDQVRMTKPYPWSKLLGPLSPETTESVHDGLRLFKWSEPPFAPLGPAKTAVVVDDRSILATWNIHDIDRWRARRTAKDKPNAPDAAMLASWREVEPCLLAAMLDNRGRQWTGRRRLRRDTAPYDVPHEFPGIEHCHFAAVGLDWRGDELLVRAVGECDTPAAAEALVAELERHLEFFQAESRARREQEAKPGKTPSGQPGEDAFVAAALALCDSAKIERDGVRVRFSAKAPLPLAAVGSILADEWFGARTAAAPAK